MARAAAWGMLGDPWVVDEEVAVQPVEVVALVFLVSFALVQPWITFATPSGAERFSRLPDDEARRALDRAVRWDRLTSSQRTAVEVVAGVLGVVGLLVGFVAGAVWLGAVAACLAVAWLAARVRRRGRTTVLVAAGARGTTPSPRTRSATRSSRQRGFTAALAVCLVAAPLAYRSPGFGPVGGPFASGVLVVVGTIALIGLVSTVERVYGDEEPD